MTQVQTTLKLMDNKIFLEAVPGMLSLVATKTAWDALSNQGKSIAIHEVLVRLGISDQLEEL